jgi:ketosteroid isomerase-like protein
VSQENVESSDRVWARFMAGDTDGVFALLDPEVEVHEPPDLPGARVYHGHAGWQAQLDKFAEAFTDFAYERLECIDCGDEVVSVIRAKGTATSSGIAGEITYAQVETWRAGRATSIRYFTSRADALKAVGLDEQAMSQKNVEVVRRFTAALVRAQDTGDWQPVLAELDPDVEIDDLDISLDTEHYRGHDKFREWIGVWNDAWESWRIEDLEVRTVGEDRAVALFSMIVTGKGSGIELSRHDAVVSRLRAGKITELGYYNDQQQALKAVGLEE